MAGVSTVAVIGAGAMGRGIARLVALGGYNTILEDLIPGALRAAEGEIRTNLEKAVERGQVSSSAANAALGRLQYAGSIEEAARQADVVIEAVPDELESKVEIFTVLDKICRPHTILVCTTTDLSVSEIASVTYRPQKCAGLRFRDPLLEARCLEIIQSRYTDEDTMAAVVEIGTHISRNTMVMKDFIV